MPNGRDVGMVEEDLVAVRVVSHTLSEGGGGIVVILYTGEGQGGGRGGGSRVEWWGEARGLVLIK